MAKRRSQPDSRRPTRVTPRVITSLKNIPVFAGLSQKDARALLEMSETVTYRKGRTIFSEGMTGKEVYLLTKGKVKITAEAPRGRTKILGILKPGEFLGEMAVLGTETRSATAFVHEDAEAIMITNTHFLDFISESPDVSLKIMRGLSRRLQDANEEIKNYTFHDQSGRLAQMIISLHERFPGEHDDGTAYIDLKLTHQDLADMMGIARESITKMISTLRKDGSIDMAEHFITIRDFDQLRDWIR